MSRLPLINTDLCLACLLQIVCVKHFSENKLNQCTMKLYPQYGETRLYGNEETDLITKT